MHLLYITKENPQDVKAYSGIHLKMYQALRRNFDNVSPAGPVDSITKYIPKLKSKFYKVFTSSIYKYQYNIALAKRMSAQIDRKINETQPDVLLASLMSPEVAYLRSELPLYITTDATFPLLKDLYGSHSNLHPNSIKEAMHLEERAFQRAMKLILPLQWLADSAMRDYNIPASKIEVIPYGSNLELNLNDRDLDVIIQNRLKNKVIKLLFVGVRWEEKGGPFAVEVLKSLLDKGIKAELWIAGCEPDIQNKPNEVHLLGFLSKENPVEAEKLQNLYKEANFFILPTKAECVGMSFIEAASFGLPAIGSKIGGVPEAVKHNTTGFICDQSHTAVDVAEWVFQVYSDAKRYDKMSSNAFRRQQEQMTWDRWGKRVKEVIMDDNTNLY